MQQNIRVFVGLDTSKMKISVALAEEGRQGEVRFLGDIDNTPESAAGRGSYEVFGVRRGYAPDGRSRRHGERTRN